MTPAAWLMMIGVLGFVWGGFLLAVVIGLRAERRKQDAVTSSAGNQEELNK